MRAIPVEIMWKHMLRRGSENLSFNNIKAAISTELGKVNDGTHPVYPRASKNYQMPSNSTMRRALRKLRLKIVEEGAHGKKAADNDWGGGGKPLTARFALEKVIVDHTELDLFVVDDEREHVLGRPWLTLAICVATRAIIGHLISFIAPSSWTVAEILKRMALPKRPPPKMAARYPILCRLFGRPAELITDNGQEFRSENALAAARGCGITWRWCPVRKPRYRAIVERALQTVPLRIMEEMPGTTLPIAEARKSDHDAEADAYVTLNELEAVTLQAIAEYNTEPHEGIDDRQPALMFEKLTAAHGIEVFKDLDTALVEFMPFEEPTVLNGAGLRWEGCRFYHAVNVDILLNDLVPLECRRMESERPSVKVRFKYDPLDISRIWVWNRKTRKFVELINDHDGYADGMPLYFHRLIKKAAEAEGAAFNSEAERLEARNRRIEAVRRIDPNEHARSMAAIAKLYETPRIRALTGNIVHLDYAPVEATVADFIEHDRASRTSFDVEVMASRPVMAEGRANPKRPRRTVEKEERDRRDAGATRKRRKCAPTTAPHAAEQRDPRDAGAPRPDSRPTPITDADEAFY
jgi:putative transposase